MSRLVVNDILFKQNISISNNILTRIRNISSRYLCFLEIFAYLHCLRVLLRQYEFLLLYIFLFFYLVANESSKTQQIVKYRKNNLRSWKRTSSASQAVKNLHPKVHLMARWQIVFQLKICNRSVLCLDLAIIYYETETIISIKKPYQ